MDYANSGYVKNFYDENGYASAYTPGPAPTPGGLGYGLVGYWNLDEATGQTRVAQVGGVNFTDSGGVPAVTGKNNNGIDNGLSGFSLTALDSPVLRISPTTGKTFAFWSRADTAQDGSGSIVLSKGDGAGNFDEYLMAVVKGGSSTLRFQWTVIGGTGNWDDASVIDVQDTGVPLDEWSLCICWYDPIDKRAHGSVNNGTTYNGVLALVGDPWNSSNTLKIGYWWKLFNYTAADELAIWNRVLSADERTELYNGGAGKFYPF